MRRPGLAALLVLGSACAPDAPPGWSWAESALRPDNPRTQDLFHFDAGDVVLELASPSGEFRIHYTRAGTHAVDLRDADGSMAPDVVERIALLYDEALAFYRARGYRAPLSDQDLTDNGGDGAFDVYLVDFARAADGSFRREVCRTDKPSICGGYMVQENDFVGYGYPSVVAAERTVASHELFHAVQAAYDADQGAILAEGTAGWATEHFDPTLTDFERQIGGYFQNADRSLDKPIPGPVDPFSYGAAIFFEHLSQQHGEDVIRDLHELTEDGVGGEADPNWYALLPAFIEARGGSFAETFTTFIDWNLHTGSAAQTGFGYTHARDYGTLARTVVTAPVDEVVSRLFYASTEVFRIAPDGRDVLELALVADDLDGVALLTAPVTGAAVQAPADRTMGSARVRYDMAGHDAVVAALVNANASGNSKRPRLCAGTPTEVDDCIARNGGVLPDAGVAPDAELDAGASLDAAPEAGVPATPDAGVAPDVVGITEEPSSCATVGPSGGLLAIGVALLVLAALRRRRRPVRGLLH